MAPVLMHGSAIIIEPLRLPLRPGCVYLYHSGEKLVLHRLISGDPDHPDRLLFRGDHPRARTERIPQDQVIGQLSRRQPSQPHTSSLHLQALIRNHLLLKNYEEIVLSFTKQAVRCTPIKGIWLLQHPELRDWHRTTSDIDLLIDTSDLQTAVSLLIQLGYCQDPAKEWRRNSRRMTGTHHLPPFRKGTLAVELHYHPFPDAPAELTRRLLEEPTVRDHQTVILLHFVRHLRRGDFQEKWLTDLKRLVMHDEVTDTGVLTEWVQHPEWPAAQELIGLLRKWKDVSVQNPEADEQYFQAFVQKHLMSGSVCSNTDWQAFFRRKQLLGRILLTLLPHPRYLRHIYPQLAGRPALRLYLHRWQVLFLKTASSLFR